MGVITKLLLCFQLVQVRTPTHVGHYKVAYILISTEAVYLLRKGRHSVLLQYSTMAVRERGDEGVKERREGERG